MRPARTVGRPDGDEQQGLEAGFEQKAGRKRPDVFAHVDNLRVVLEGLSGFHRRTQAIKDAGAGCPRDSPPQYASVLTRRVGPAPRPSKYRK